jgi:NADH-quinone oxidoreductase subunit M
LTDLSRRERAVLLPLIVVIFVMGICPGPFFERTRPAVQEFLRHAAVRAHVSDLADSRRAGE